MIEKIVTIHHKDGFHARPASDFVKKAKTFKARIEIIKEEKKADAKSIVGVLSLGLPKGAVVTVRADGDDESEAMHVLVPMIEGR